MTKPKDSPPYRLAFCPHARAERVAGAPAELQTHLSPAELVELETAGPRRRLDRLAGRLAAKRALAAHFSAEDGWQADPRELEIFNDESGRPTLRLPAGAAVSAPSFSLSHCAEGGAAAVGAPGRLVGVDLETVVARPAEVLAFVCAPGEDRDRDPEAQARLWTGKEAALKLLGLGLEADARAVIDKDGEVAFTGSPAEVWNALDRPRVRVAYKRVAGAMLAVAFTGD
ncbi:MAG: 4'-phosphopantetheinyl transferase superfamily protein [Elusimicrobiota bacterium]